ncbi:MAG TPA: PepSY domain-containing protein [Pseudomonadales bacterium]
MKPVVRGFLLRWHRRVGLMAVAFIMVVSITGIALNHTKGLGLGVTVHQSWLLALYGIEPPSVSIAMLGDTPVVHDGVDRLYRGTHFTVQCGDWFAGAVGLPQGWMAACGNALWIFDGSDQLLERIGPEHGLPGTVEAVAARDGIVQVLMDGQAWIFDAEHLSFTPAEGQEPAWVVVVTQVRGVPGVPDIPAGSTLTVEQVILDLHSGRLFGQFTVLLMDLSGVAMLLLGISGLFVWGSRRKNC